MKIIKPEDPRKIKDFRATLDSLDWQSPRKSLPHLFGALDALAQAEVDFYFARRRSSRSWSGFWRAGAWLAGSIGVILPLLGATGTLPSFNSTAWGYFFFAIAGSFLAANQLFGGTAGHVRYASTQLALEAVITTNRIRWSAWSAAPETTIEEAFELLSTYATELYALTNEETGAWGKAVLADLAKYAANAKISSATRVRQKSKSRRRATRRAR